MAGQRACVVGLSLALVAAAPSPKQSDILGELERLDQACAQSDSAVRASEAQKEQLTARLAELQRDQSAAQARQQALMERYRRRLRALARLPAGPSLTMLSQSQSLSDHLQAHRLLRLVAEQDAALGRALRERTEQLQTLSTQTQAQSQALSNTLEQSRSQLRSLESDRARRADLVRGVRREPHAAPGLAAERRAAQRRLQAMVSPPSLTTLHSHAPGSAAPPAGAAEGPFAQLRGSLPWPAPGPVKVAFGQRVELAFGTATSHNGWDIGAAAATPVRAVADGQVAFAGWLRGYGQMVIVDHGDGYHSIYAHLARLDVAVGAPAQAGQPLGEVGDTGSLRGTVLYFEIRHRGAALDPRSWLR